MAIKQANRNIEKLKVFFKMVLADSDFIFSRQCCPDQGPMRKVKNTIAGRLVAQ